MTSSTHITIRRTGRVLATAVLGAVLAGSALAGNGSGLNLPPQAAIKGPLGGAFRSSTAHVA